MFSARHKGWIGVDLGTSAVKLAQVERTGRAGPGRAPSAGWSQGMVAEDGRGGWSWRLAHARVLRRPVAESPLAGAADTQGDGVLDWWDQICGGQRLREGFSGRRSACVLPAARADLRAINLPEGSDTERRAMIGNELEGLSGEDAGRRVFDYWDVRPPEQSKLENVNVLSLPEHEALAVVGSLARAGLCCRVIDGLPLAIARAVSMANGADAATPVGALDWGAASATFSILWDQRPVFTRQFRDCGFAAMPAAVSQALGVSIDDAEQLLSTHGVCGPAERNDPMRDVQEVITDVTSGLLSEIVSQLNKTLSYPELHRSGLVPAKIWLLGGGATVRNLASLLSAKIHRSVETWHLPSAGAESGEGLVPPAAMLGPAIALSALAFA
jgi:type IV pilus assembly protein PilM